MKKKVFVSVCIMLAVLLVGVIIWWNLPEKRIDVDYDNIEKIVVTDLATGEEFIVTDKHEKMSIVIPYQAEGNSFKKVGISFDDSDYGYQVKIKIKDKSSAELNGWDEFIVNSDDRIKKGLFYYKQYDADYSVYVNLRFLLEKFK